MFRQTRLLLLTTLIKIVSSNQHHYIATAQTLVGDIAASIPYHLTDNLQVFLREGKMETGRGLGGLLLMHPLYVASMVDESMRSWLVWIAENMGIGQAGLLAKMESVDMDYLESADMIIWAGFLG